MVWGIWWVNDWEMLKQQQDRALWVPIQLQNALQTFLANSCQLGAVFTCHSLGVAATLWVTNCAMLWDVQGFGRWALVTLVAAPTVPSHPQQPPWPRSGGSRTDHVPAPPLRHLAVGALVLPTFFGSLSGYPGLRGAGTRPLRSLCYGGSHHCKEGHTWMVWFLNVLQKGLIWSGSQLGRCWECFVTLPSFVLIKLTHLWGVGFPS